jgi:hypothetical protein
MTISSIDIFEEKKCIYNVSSTQEFTHTGTIFNRTKKKHKEIIKPIL